MKLKKKSFVSFMALLLAILMILGIVLPSILYADTLSDLQDEQDRIDSETEEQEEELERLNAQIEALTKEIGTYDSQIQQTEDRLQELNAQIDDNEALLEQTQIELEEAQERADEYLVALTARIQRMYENDTTSYLELLFRSETISEFFCRLEYVRSMMEYDNDVMNGLKETTQQIADSKVVIETTQAALEEDRAEVEDTQAQLESTRAQKAVKLAEVQESTEAVEDKLVELATMSDDIQARIEEAEAEIQRQKEEEERKRQEEEAKNNAANNSSSSGVVSAGSLSFRWPLVGWTSLSDYFGPRIHPIYGTYSNHNGIDIPAYSGTDIHAIESGVVIVASGVGNWNGGYGNYIMISHGDGYVSLYAHCSKVYVTEGQTVSKGDVIGAVGTTGNSTGNHLHLELRIDGTRVDPLDYVPMTW